MRTAAAGDGNGGDYYIVELDGGGGERKVEAVHDLPLIVEQRKLWVFRQDYYSVQDQPPKWIKIKHEGPVVTVRVGEFELSIEENIGTH